MQALHAATADRYADHPGMDALGIVAAQVCGYGWDLHYFPDDDMSEGATETQPPVPAGRSQLWNEIR